VFVVDSPDGLYGPNEGAVGQGYQIKNADSDPSLELVITTTAIDARLPNVRLERGGLPPDAWLRIKALGLSPSGDSTVAIGELKGAKFGAGIDTLRVPFNLLPAFLPPRVTGIVPLVDNCALLAVTILFSKAVDARSLAGSIAVHLSGVASDNVMEVRLDPTSAKFADVLLSPEIPIAGPVAVTVEVSTNVEDDGGNALDDVPMQPGAQPYSEELTFAPDPTKPCGTSNLPRCGDGAPDQAELCPSGFACGEAGVCLPESCDVVSCAPGYVCDTATFSCEVDCRPYGDEPGACPDGKACDPERGVCR
jgi:hypothetical protein